MIPSIKHLIRRIIIKFNQSAFSACIIKFTVEYVGFSLMWLQLQSKYPNFFEERKAQMEH